MKPQDIERMIAYMAGGVETAEDIKFVDQNLDGFATWLFNVTTNELQKKGFEVEEAQQMLACLMQVSRMVGAKDFNEFATFHQIVQDF